MSTSAVERLKESVTLPVIMAPLFIISNPEMTMKACEAGIIGTFPALNARTNEKLEQWLQQMVEGMEQLKENHPEKKIAPWGINFISHRTNKRFLEDLKLIEKYEPPLVITSLGDPSPVVEVVHAYGGVVFSDVINVKYAKKAIEKGVDGLVLVTSGAGGHGGTYNPFAFIHEVKRFWDGPIALAGAISKGEDILAAEILGADFSYIGTRFIPAKESGADEKYKEMVIDSTIEDILYTDAFSGIHANFLIPSIKKAGMDPNELKKKEQIDLSELANTDVKAWRDVWSAGQGVGSITKIQSVEEIVEDLTKEYNTVKEKIIKEAYNFTE
ncbi:NAD(P)H-dependent flavin oxidoreductase [Fervidibacillus albus]|uniref:Probable nitronate monooxygenase n=1 Tax=Fervidibacillus albus TaxID=2980026 RepID=A0A9E8LV75_9BACI|nr:nitronate monooxygenase [Fervidibacillus albus]WAA09746.1 nitronate monooxygenase [Fervidibacillus albus]